MLNIFSAGSPVAGDVGGDRLQPQAVTDGFGHERLVLHHQHPHPHDATSRRISSAYEEPHTGWQPEPAFSGAMACPAAAHRQSRTGVGSLAVGLLVLAAAVVAVLGYQAFSTPSTSNSEVVRGGASTTAAVADGFVPDGVTVFDDRYAGVADQEGALLAALRSAATDAAAEGVIFQVNSGWRSRAYQDQLLREAVAEYGSAAEAARWVATADTSPHVVRGRRRPRHRGRRVAGATRRRIRTLPDLPQRAVARPAAFGHGRARVSRDVCGPHLRSADAAVSRAADQGTDVAR